MNPTTDPGVALREGFYVDPPGSALALTLQRQLELDPASTHLVLGGIGSGKTSTLLKTIRDLSAPLREVGDHVAYCDVSTQYQLATPATVGVLVALTGRLLREALPRTRELPPELDSVIQRLNNFADGHTEIISRAQFEYENHKEYEEDYEGEDYEREDYEDYDEPDEIPVHRPGVLTPPPKPRALHWTLRAPVGDLRDLLAAHPGPDKHAIIFFDSLDRLPRPETFVTLVQEDIRALKAAGIGAVVVGPIRYLVGLDRGISELFDYIHYNMSVDPHEEGGLAFLCDVLRRRADDSILREELLPPLAKASGGVLRDLIKIAKRSAEEAYTAGRDQIEMIDVARAREAEGRSLAIGLDDEQLKMIRTVHTTGTFVIRGERELSLLETRRLLLYESNRWIVHPALAPLLDLFPEAG